jgi:hypothetical protein
MPFSTSDNYRLHATLLLSFARERLLAEEYWEKGEPLNFLQGALSRAALEASRISASRQLPEAKETFPESSLDVAHSLPKEPVKVLLGGKRVTKPGGSVVSSATAWATFSCLSTCWWGNGMSPSPYQGRHHNARARSQALGRWRSPAEALPHGETFRWQHQVALLSEPIRWSPSLGFKISLPPRRRFSCATWLLCCITGFWVGHRLFRSFHQHIEERFQTLLCCCVWHFDPFLSTPSTRWRPRSFPAQKRFWLISASMRLEGSRARRCRHPSPSMVAMVSLWQRTPFFPLTSN